MRTIQDLQQLQGLPLNLKIRMTKERIRQWINEYGEDGVYVSFSGGKDSTVLLHLVREDFPNIKGVFVDTGLEFPEIRSFVRTFDNIEWLKPKMGFKQVIQKYGYPFISKEVLYELQKYSGQKWIPCSERLPDQEGAYLVTIDERETEEGIPGVEKVLWHKGQWKTYSSMFNGLYPIGLKVTAWMPLPEPYKP